ncbi:TPA: hypothetical protein VAM28_003250 [Acinetobacter baumannii]|nr:hypothetical protein [Acinetobacter baumannii]MDV7410013.1 hypothetical protein [Acinetobacter baumannii]HEO1767560.1 hypothetical protein [Acinetobacter baumannii]
MAIEISPLKDFIQISTSLVNETGNITNQYYLIIDLQNNILNAHSFINKITQFQEIEKLDKAIHEQLNSLYKILLRVQNKSLNLENYDFTNLAFKDTQSLLKNLINSIKTLEKLVSQLNARMMTLQQTYNEVTISDKLSRMGEEDVKFELINEANYLIRDRNALLNYSTQVIELAENTLLSITEAANIINENLIKENLLKSSFSDRLNEEKSLLIKQFNNELSIIKERYETAFKSYESDRERVQQSANLLATAVDAGLKNANELNEKTQNLEQFFSTIINEKKSEIDEELETERKTISTNIKDVKEALFAEEKTIRDAHKDFLTLVGNAGIYKLTENYNEKAKDEKKEYKRFRRYTAYSLIAAIFSTFFIFIWALFDKPDTTYDFMGYLWQPESSNTIDYFLLLSRLSISLMFFVLAYYLSKQASKHYECYQENHRTFLQLAALEPFMVKMNEDEQKIIRKGLIPTYFNQNADGKFAPSGEEIGFPSSITSPIEKLAEVLKPIIDKAVDKGSDSSKP